jgi:GR25 family glycosyltransferase involved in LPS biosynthesis
LVILISKRNWEHFSDPVGLNRLDAIIYINLENRGDRKDLLLKELESLGVNISKLHKVSGVFIPKNGHKGCVQSHILALQMIKLNKWKRVLILEDDAQLTIPPSLFNPLIEQSLEILDSSQSGWNVLMLATANKILDNTTRPQSISLEYTPETTIPGTNDPTTTKSTTKPITEYKLEKIKSATTSSAYIVNGDYVDTILKLFELCNTNMNHGKLSSNNYEHWALDQRWAEIQDRDRWFALTPDPITQREIWSTTMTESHY